MSGPVVLDASAALVMVVGPAAEPIHAALAGASEVIAPALFAAEVANALWKYVQAGILRVEDAQARLHTALALCDRLTAIDQAPDSVLVEALGEACRLSHPVYDLLYLVLARRHGATLVTCDRRLGDLAHSQGLKVVGLSGRPA
jgi:predicted nucleic acid-binding protein